MWRELAPHIWCEQMCDDPMTIITEIRSGAFDFSPCPARPGPAIQHSRYKFMVYLGVLRIIVAIVTIGIIIINSIIAFVPSQPTLLPLTPWPGMARTSDGVRAPHTWYTRDAYCHQRRFIWQDDKRGEPICPCRRNISIL